MNRTIVVRIIFAVLGVLLLFGGFRLSSTLAGMKEAPPVRSSGGVRVTPVQVMTAQNETIPTSLDLQGRLVAFDKIQIFAEVTGVLEESSRPFKVGSYFPKGAVLAKIDATEALLNIQAQKSSLLNAITQFMPDLKIDYSASFPHWNEYLNNFDLEAPIKAFPEPISDQEKYFIASKNIYSQYYNIKSAEARIEKYVLEAPFNGVITSASINPGSLVRSGQPIGELMRNDNYELEATVPLADLKYIKVGNKVVMYSDDVTGDWAGRIRRISDQIDAATQTVKVFIAVSGKNLREGMYMTGTVEASPITNAMRLSRDLLVDQKYVYMVKDSVLELLEVEVIKFNPDDVIVQGIEDGTPLLKEMVTGAFNGKKVRVE